MKSIINLNLIVVCGILLSQVLVSCSTSIYSGSSSIITKRKYMKGYCIDIKSKKGKIKKFAKDKTENEMFVIENINENSYYNLPEVENNEELDLIASNENQIILLKQKIYKLIKIANLKPSVTKSIKLIKRQKSNFKKVEDSSLNGNKEVNGLVFIIAKSGDSQDSSKVLIVSSKVGELIDSTEKAKYHLFPFYSKAEFQSAQFVQMPDNSIVLKAIMKDGSIKEKLISEKEFLWTKTIIDSGNKQKFYNLAIPSFAISLAGLLLSGLAVLSGCGFGVLALFGLILGLLAIILGGKALSNSEKRSRGKGFAIAGIFIGFAASLIGIVTIIALLFCNLNFGIGI